MRICSPAPGDLDVKKEQECYFRETVDIQTHTFILLLCRCWTSGNNYNMNENVTCDPQSDSRFTSISPTWLVCYEPELVLSWVALSQVCDSQTAALLRTTVLNTILIIWVCSQIQRLISSQFTKPESFLNFSIMAIFSGWVSVGAAYFHCWSF